jgi:hypothetical protein
MRALEGACQGWGEREAQIWENPMADSMFGFFSILDSRTAGEAAGSLWLSESASPGMVSPIASPPGGLSEFFLKGIKPAATAKGSGIAIPASQTNFMLTTPVTLAAYGMESRFLALVHSPGARSEGLGGRSTPSHTTALRKAGRELARRNARSRSDHSKSQIVHWSVRLSVPKRRSNELRKDSNTL